MEYRTDESLELGFEMWSTTRTNFCIHTLYLPTGDVGGTVVKVLYYKSEGRWFDPSWSQWIFH